MCKNDIKIGFQIKTINNLIKRRIDSSDTVKEIHQMTGTNAWMIAYIDQMNHERKTVFQKDIEEHFCITRSCVSKVIRLMEQKQLIIRESVDQDARLKKLILTSKAAELATGLKSNADQMEGDLTAGFTVEELEQLQNYLKRLEQNIQNSLNNITCKEVHK